MQPLRAMCGVPLASACRVTGVRVFRDAVLANHVHLVVSFRPDIRLSDFVRLAKSVAATRANRRIPGTVRWARGYFVTTIHKRDLDRKSTRLNSSHLVISYAVFCLKKKKTKYE